MVTRRGLVRREKGLGRRRMDVTTTKQDPQVTKKEENVVIPSLENAIPWRVWREGKKKEK